MPASAAPSILNKSYTITAEVEIPEGGAEGMIVTEGGRFGGYGLFLSKGVAGLRSGKPVFLYNLLNLKRTIWEGPELSAGKHTIVFDFKSDGPGLGKGGTGILVVDGKEVDRKSMEHSMPVTFPEDESFDVGMDTRSGVAMLRVPLRSTVQVHRQDQEADVQARTRDQNRRAIHSRTRADRGAGAGSDRTTGPGQTARIEAAEMNGTPRPLLALMGAAEAATGLVLATAPDLLVELLLGTAPSTVAGVTVSRVAGVALLALGVACWLARQDAEGRAARGLIAAILLYNVAVVAILVLAWANQGMSGIALWPVVLAHAALAVWCVVTLSAASKVKRS